MNSLLIILLAMVVIIPICHRLGLGAVLGYLIAGALIGPSGFGLLGPASSETKEIAELGVIMMLLLIGIELSPALLWKMRGPLFGLGGIQVAGTIAAFAGVLYFVGGKSGTTAVVCGMILASSSTAVVLQTLKERGYAKSVAGERAFAVLLFQDLAVIPMLAALPLLGTGESGVEGNPARKAALILAAVASVIVAGRLVVRPLFALVARTRVRETFTALALLIVFASAALMHAVGLSPALGAFLAGVVLADSEYRHQLEADIEPFKGILLGLFFITIGAGIRFGLLLERPGLIAAWTLGIVLVKGAVLFPLARLFRLRTPESFLFAVSLAQGGEFAFVLLGQTAGAIPAETAEALAASVALTMALAPVLISLAIRFGLSRLECAVPEERAPDVIDESERENPVIVIGVGRFGQTLIRFLRAYGYRSTVLDIDSEQIEIIARFGIRSYFGDGANLDLLRAAGIERAQALVVAVDEPETALRIAEEVRRFYPTLPIFSRAYDRIHAYRLLHLGVREVAIETSGSALGLGERVLAALGVPDREAAAKALRFRVNNERSIRELAVKFHEQDGESFIQSTRQMGEQLEAMLRSDPEKVGREETV